MGFAENGNGLSAADVAAVMGGNGNGFGFGNDGSWWLIVLLILLFNNGNWGNNAGNGNNGYIPLDNSIQRGFDQSAIMTGIQGVQSAVTSGFGDNALGLSNLAQTVTSQGYQGQIAMLQGFNNMQSQFADCCCENRLGIANLGADIAREACAGRQAVSEGLLNLTAQNNQNTNALINTMNAGFQSLRDQNFQQQLDAERRTNAELRTQLNMQNLAASQAQQTAQLVADNAAQTQYVVNRVAPYPIPSYNVSNPFGSNCGCNNGCGFAA